MTHSIVSILHHSLPSIGDRIAEEEGVGWHFRSARALTKYGGFKTISLRPGDSRRWMYRRVDGVDVWLAPRYELPVPKMFLKWREISPPMTSLVKHLVKKHGYIAYIHEYRALNSELVMRAIIDYPMILQHHGSSPPRIGSVKGVQVAKEVSKMRREKLLRRVRGAIFVVNVREKEYLENVLGADSRVMFRTMAVDFNKLKPPSEEEEMEIRRRLGIPEDAVVLTSYIGVFREEISTIKGAHLIPRIWKKLKKHYGDRRLKMIVTGVSGRYSKALRRLGIKAYEFLPHNEYLKLVKASDIYFIPATKSYYGGPGGVSIMEALALGKVVVSPTFLEMPDPQLFKNEAVITSYIQTDKNLHEFIQKLVYAIDNMHRFNPQSIRAKAWKVFSWESFIRDFIRALKKIKE